MAKSYFDDGGDGSKKYSVFQTLFNLFTATAGVDKILAWGSIYLYLLVTIILVYRWVR